MPNRATIADVEILLQHALEALPSSRAPAEITSALKFLAPSGYHPVVELQEDGRKKRRTASADHWSPETGEILIYFSRNESTGQAQPVAPAPQAPAHLQKGPVSGATRTSEKESAPSTSPELALCSALEEVERGGRAFVALKWFRDEILPGKGFAWAVDAEERQSVLAKAIEDGLVMTNRIPNPRSPSFPTTTIRLNRSRAVAPDQGRRYRPVPIQGEPLSSTIHRERGKY